MAFFHTNITSDNAKCRHSLQCPVTRCFSTADKAFVSVGENCFGGAQLSAPPIKEVADDLVVDADATLDVAANRRGGQIRSMM